MQKKILVVDDEKDIVELVRYNLEKEGYRIISAYDGEKSLDLVKREMPDLIILDLMLPGTDGLEVCRILKNDSRTSPIPVIMLTAKGEETDIVVGLELGADDYVTKPFSVRQLIARVKAVLRRTSAAVQEEDLIKIDDFAIDSIKHEVTLKGKSLSLTFTEFKLLKCLAGNPGRVFTRDQLLNRVWGDETFIVDRAVDVHIRRLRKKLGKACNSIVTVRGIGYKFGIAGE
jgi:phosphate regulon transcriptional regulator PhoB